MKKETFRIFYILLIFLIIININIISAGEIDQATNDISKQALSDGTGIDEVLNDEATDANIETDSKGGNDESSPATVDNSQSNTSKSDNANNSSDTPKNDAALKKAYLSTSNYVIKNNYLKVYLKDSSQKPIAKETVFLTINGKTLSSRTDNDGTARFNITNPGKTYQVNLKFNGNSIYGPSTKTFNLRVIASPIYTKITLAERGIIVNDTLKVYVRTKDGKALAKQDIKITFDGRTYNRTTNKNGFATLRINRKSQIYDLSIKYPGTGNYMPVIRKTSVNVINSKVIGKTSYGKVYFLDVIGNRSSKVRIAYVVGLHPIEHQIHDSVYKVMKNKVDMRYKYYIYRIVLTKKSGDYSTDRMRGQLLAKNYIVPHAKKQKFNLVIDIHSTTGTSYAKTYFIHVPKNKHAPSMKLAKKTIVTIKSIEKNSKMVYWSPQSQTSPPYIHLPLINAGTPTFVFETWTYEKKSQSDNRAKILTTAVDKIFG